MAPPRTMVITSSCSLLLIYRPRKDERLSWPNWVTYSGRFTHISGHPSAVGRAQDSESSPVKDQRSTAEPRNQPHILNVYIQLWCGNVSFILLFSERMYGTVTVLSIQFWHFTIFFHHFHFHPSDAFQCFQVSIDTKLTTADKLCYITMILRLRWIWMLTSYSKIQNTSF